MSEQKTQDTFFDAVVKLRSLQKEFFQTRSRDTLRECKAQEQIVDRMIEDNGQQTLFER